MPTIIPTGIAGAAPAGAFGLSSAGTFTSGPPTPPTPPVTYPIPHVYVSLADPFSALPTWVEITQWCQRVETQWGRDHELQQVEAGTVVLDMDDRTGLFSSWNTTAPWVNLLNYADSEFIPASIVSTLAATEFPAALNGGGWTITTPAPATSTAPIVGLGIDGGFSLLVQPTSTGSWLLTSGAGTAGIPVTAGTTYTAVGSFIRHSGTSRACTVGISWYNSAGALISTITGTTSVTDTTAWAQASVTAAAPTGAVTAAIVCRVLVSTSPAAGETHLVCRPGLTQRYTDPASQVVVDNTAWGPGGYGITIGRPVHVTGVSAGMTYDIGYGYVSGITPTIDDEQNKIAVTAAADVLHLVSNDTVNDSFYPGQVLADGAVLYWRLNDAFGSLTAADFTGSGNTGFTTTGTVPTAIGPSVPLVPITFGGSPARLSSLSGSAGAQPFPVILSYVSTPPVLSPSMSAMSACTFETWFQATIASSTPDTAVMGMVLGTAASFAIEVVIPQPADPHKVVIGDTLGGSVLATGTVNLTDGNWHHIAATYNNTSGAASIYVDGTFIGSGTMSTGQLTGVNSFYTFANLSGIGGSSGVNIADVAVYPTALSGTAIDIHYQMGAVTPFPDVDSGYATELLLVSNGIPTSFLNFESGISVLALTVGDIFSDSTITVGTSTLMAVIQQIVASEQGLFFQAPNGSITFWNREYAISAPAATVSQATFANTTTGGFYYQAAGFEPVLDDLDLWNDVPTESQLTDVAYDVSDSNSIARYGKRSLQGYTDMLFANDNDTVALGQWLLSLYHIPYPRVRSITVSSIANAGANIPLQCGLSLLDLITVVYNPQDAGTSFDQAAQLEQLSHVITPGPRWETTYGLTPYTFGSNHWFTLNDPVLGVLAGAGSSAANQLAF